MSYEDMGIEDYILVKKDLFVSKHVYISSPIVSIAPKHLISARPAKTSESFSKRPYSPAPSSYFRSLSISHEFTFFLPPTSFRPNNFSQGCFYLELLCYIIFFTLLFLPFTRFDEDVFYFFGISDSLFQLNRFRKLVIFSYRLLFTFLIFLGRGNSSKSFSFNFYFSSVPFCTYFFSTSHCSLYFSFLFLHTSFELFFLLSFFLSFFFTSQHKPFLFVFVTFF